LLDLREDRGSKILPIKIHTALPLPLLVPMPRRGGNRRWGHGEGERGDRVGIGKSGIIIDVILVVVETIGRQHALGTTIVRGGLGGALHEG
jgi:hypothetical protein